MELQNALANLQNAQNQDKKRQKRNNLIVLFVGFALGILIIWAENIFLSSYPSGSLLLFLTLLLTLPLQLVLHEIGHLIFGLYSGYRFVSFRVFSFAIYKKENKFRFGRYRVPGTMGQCLMCPTKEDATMPYRALLLGGVFVNGITAVLCFLLLPILYHNLFWRLFLMGMILWGILLAALNGIPYQNKTNGIANDGYHVKILPHNHAERTCFFNQLRTAAAMTEGKRLSEMPIDWFATPSDPCHHPTSATLRMGEAERECELCRFDSAQAMLLALAENGTTLPATQLLAILTDYLYLEMITTHRQEIIEPLRVALDRHLKLTRNSFAAIRAEITYHYLFTGDLNKIAALHKRFNALAKQFPFAGEIARERQLIALPEALYRSWSKQPHA